MRDNRILGAAIVAALSLQISAVQAVGLDNVNSTTHAGTGCIAAKETGSCVLDGSNNPHSTFDNVSGGNPVVNVPTGGIVYAKELFGGDGPPKLPNGDEMAAVIYTLSTLTDIEQQLKVTFTLSDGVFASSPKLAISDDPTKGGTFTSFPLDTDGGEGKNFITFLIDSGDTKPLVDGDQLMLAYEFKQASTLATDDGEVVLTAEIRDKSTDSIVNPTRRVTIATSKQAVQCGLKIEEAGHIKISVAEGSKLFIGDGTGAHIDEDTAQIGFLKVTNVGGGIKESDGKTDFRIGDGTDGLVKPGVINDDGSTEGSILRITNGQFAASKQAPGQAYLEGYAERPATVSSDGTAATRAWDDEQLKAISTGTDIGIRLNVDRLTPIGPTTTDENPPLGVLTLIYDQDAYVKSLCSTDPVPLRQIHQDGTVCLVYNVPSTAVVLEKINIRVCNNTNVDGELSGKLYTENGDMIGTLQSLGSVASRETVVFNAETLEGLFGTWEGRALLEITSTLPSLEVLALMRNQNDRGLLTNLSVGATGSACNNN